MPSITKEDDVNYSDVCRKQEKAWQPIVDECLKLGIFASVEQTGGMVFCVEVLDPDSGQSVWWGVANETWGGSDSYGERNWDTDIRVSDKKYHPVTKEQGRRIAKAIASSLGVE